MSDKIYNEQDNDQQVHYNYKSNSVRKRGRDEFEQRETTQDPVRGPQKKKIMIYSNQELRARRQRYGSSNSVYDRKKFAREFDVSSLHLSAEEEEIYEKNPHIQQVFANQRKFHRCTDVQFALQHRILQDNSPRTPYHRRQGEAKTVDHWGQRKLLFSEIEFLTLYGDKDHLVVYAGAAPGTHTNYLSRELFPDYKFLLVDPSLFEAYETDKIRIINDFFTDGLAEECAKQKTIFISDIRSMKMEMGEDEKERCVIRDMEMQKNWRKTMKPKATMLKFRLPYKPGKTTYLKGDIFLPVWGPRTTTETRLVVTTEEEKEYDHTDYESQMFHFNTETRTTYFEHEIEGEGLDHCYDCMSEIFILRTYLERIKGITDEAELKKQVSIMSYNISREISKTGRTLKLEEENPFERHKRREKEEQELY